MLKILNHEIKRGEKMIADYQVRGADGHTVFFSYYIIAGKHDGPVACITSGVHGTEYPGIGANFQLYHDISPAELTGTIIGVPICNQASFTDKIAFVNPLDRKNLNDIFPGKSNGTISEKLCSTLIHEIALKADFHIDLHSGDNIEYLYPYTFCHMHTSNPKNTAASREMAQVYGLDFIVYTESSDTAASDKGTFYATVSELGIPSIQPEIGGVGLMQEETKMLHYTGVRNVLAYKGMLDHTIKKNTKQRELSRFYRLKSECNGIYHRFVSPGQFVKKGDLLARITDYHAEETYFEFFAEENAVVLWVMSSFATKIGENLMALAFV